MSLRGKGMKLARNIKAISKLLFVLLLLTALIIGAIFSYLWVIGYYITLDRVYATGIAVNITNYAFDYQNTSYFNVTIQCPTSYTSKEPANITRITVSTEDGKHYDVNSTDPSIPYKFKDKGESQTFKCLWNWENYTGETIKIIAFVADGSGATKEAKTPLVKLEITNLRFNSTISVTHFNMTVQNLISSVTYVNVTEITVDTYTLNSENVTPSLPRMLDPGSSVTLMCSWNWTNYQNTSVTVAVSTLQGYMISTAEVTPLPVVLEITNVLFEPANTTCFNMTLRNGESSPTYVNITRITATTENGTVQEINGANVSPPIQPAPYPLDPNATKTFKCPWNWARYWDKNVTITVYTLQNFTAQYAETTPSPINITQVIFKPDVMNQFNVTINNSKFYFTSVNITEITLTVENKTFPINGTEVTSHHPLPYQLQNDSSATFLCLWNWTNYQGKNITIIVRSLENYTTHFTEVTPTRVILAIMSVLFNHIDTTGFNLTVWNSNSSVESATIADVTITQNGTTIGKITISPSQTVNVNSTVPFRCPWVWTNYRGNIVTITVFTKEGYEASTVYTIPSES
jgi:hypothetical protein